MQVTAREQQAAPQADGLPLETRVAFVSNFAPHYRIKMFEALAKMCRLECYFYSDGGEWYWQRAHGVNRGNFNCRYLAGVWLGRTRIAPALAPALLFGKHDAVIKCINDRLAVPLTYLAARIRRRPFVLWTGVWCRLTTPFQRFLFPLTRYLYCHADAIVVYGSHVRDYLVGEGVEARRIFIAPQAVDNEHYSRQVPLADQQALRCETGIAPGQKLLLYVGRLEPIKGLEHLLEGFALCRRADCTLVLCGQGSIEADLRRQAERLGIAGRVVFAGYVPTAKTVAFYSIAWAAVLPSVTTPGGRETWGLVANEAFNQGVPLIASDAVGAVAGGLVRHMQTGIVVPEANAAALGGAIDRILSDPSLRNAMSANARREVAGWTQTRMAEGFRDAVWFALNQEQQAGHKQRAAPETTR